MTSTARTPVRMTWVRRALAAYICLACLGAAAWAEVDIVVDLPGGSTMALAWIEPGSFVEGSSDADRLAGERPEHMVTLSTGYYIGKHEVTQQQWKSVMGTSPWVGQSHPAIEARSGDDYPAAYLSWEDAEALVARLNEATHTAVYRLPTEAEWEYAARAGSDEPWAFGGHESYLHDYAWYWDNTCDVGECYPHEVGLKLPNAWGLFDMHGNVWEWTQDWWFRGYTAEARIDPVGPDSGTGRALRGGGLQEAATTWSSVRIGPSAECPDPGRCVGYGEATARSLEFGVRLVRTTGAATAITPATWGQTKDIGGSPKPSMRDHEGR
jgi:formylglycine-generating enzyme required for sulfatase activity